MIHIKKGYNIKLITLFIGTTFLIIPMAYSQDFFLARNLRVPLLDDEKQPREEEIKEYLMERKSSDFAWASIPIISSRIDSYDQDLGINTDREMKELQIDKNCKDIRVFDIGAGTAQYLEELEERYDRVIGYAENIIREAARVLKPGKKAYLYIHQNENTAKWTIFEELRSQGYIIEQSKDVIKIIKSSNETANIPSQESIANQGHETIRNNSGQTFNDIWNKWKKEGLLENVPDLTMLRIDTEEQEYSDTYAKMSLEELEGVLTYLINSRSFGIYIPKQPATILPAVRHPLLQAFIDILSESDEELGHHIKDPLSNIELSKEILYSDQCEISIEDKKRLEKVIADAYRYKAFMREIIIRWKSPNNLLLSKDRDTQADL